MKTVVFFLVITGCLFFACEEHRDTQQPNKQSVPEPLQDDSRISIMSKGRDYSNLVEELYEDQVTQTPALQKLEDELALHSDAYQKLVAETQLYTSKSIRYYQGTFDLVQTLQDSVLKNQIRSLIEQHRKNYDAQTEELKGLLDVLAHTQASIEDYHTAFKIIQTMPVIARYQKENMPASKPYKTLQKQADSTLAKVKKHILDE